MYSVSVQYVSSHTYPSDMHGCFTLGIHNRSFCQRRLAAPGNVEEISGFIGQNGNIKMYFTRLWSESRVFKI